MIAAAGTVISSVFSVYVIRRFGTGLVVIFSILLTALMLFSFSMSKSFLLLCLFAFPLGLGSGSVDASLNNYVALHYKARHMSWLHCFWGVGASIGPLIMSFYLINRDSWNSGYRTISIVQICLVLLLIFSLPLWKKNILPENKQEQNKIEFKKIISITGVKEALCAFFCYCSLEILTGIWGASFLVMERGIQPEIAARWISLYYLGITSGRFLSGFLTIKLNNRQMIRLGQIIIGSGIIVLILPFGNSTLLPGLFMIGLGCAPIFPSLIHETPRNFGQEYSQAIVGIQMGSAYIGTTIMPIAFGWVTSLSGFKIFPVFMGIILIIKIILVEVLNRKVDRNKKPDHIT